MAGISLAPADNALTASPVWERIDPTYRVQSWTIDRGRPDEMSRTDTGTATIELVDKTGAFDPTNPTSPFFGRLIAGLPMGPLVQARIELQNPVTTTWATLFRGFIASIRWVPYRSEQHANVTLELVDGLALLAACEMAPGETTPGSGIPKFGHANIDGNIVFNEDLNVNAVQTRINKVLDQAGWPASLRSIFTGNVKLMGGSIQPPGAGVYSPRSTVLSVIQDAADAEFPEASNVYISGPHGDRGEAPPGSVVFHGRFARFNPADVAYNIRTWQAGDDAAAAVSPSTVVRVSPPLTASLDDTTLFTSALSMPQGIADENIDDNYVTNTVSAGRWGLRTWSAENLATFGGVTTTAEAETKLFADYVHDNYSVPRIRIGQLTIKPRRVGSPNAAATWAMLTGVEISDIVHLKTTHGGGGGFNTDFYIEGIHYQARPGGGIPYVELTLDVSPRGYYDANPFD